MPDDTADDAPQIAARLHELADRINDLVRALRTSRSPGVPQLHSFLATAHELSADGLTQVTAFHGSTAARRPDAPSVALRLSFAFEEAAHACAQLAIAQVVAHEPVQGGTDEELPGALHEAAKGLHTCAHACRTTALWLHPTRRPGSPAPAKNQPRAPGKAAALTGPQHRALHLIGQGGARLQESPRKSTYVSVPGGARVHLATFQALVEKGLVHRDTRTSLYVGQALTVTERGRSALAALPPPTGGAAAGLRTTPPKAPERRPRS